jgi:hypothetical protein
MCYTKYDQDIVSKYKVKLVGWPKLVKFANPYKIGTIGEIQKLYQALKVGRCRWVAQSQRQQAAHMEMPTKKVDANELVVKKRKQRSDKRKMREKGDKGKKVRKRAQNEEVGGSMGAEDNSDREQKSRLLPKKKQKSVATGRTHTMKKLPPASKSKAFISDSVSSDEYILSTSCPIIYMPF